MAADGEDRRSISDESENESVLRSMRRRAASDDDDGEHSDGGEQPHGRGEIGSDGESDGEGAAPELEDDEQSEEDVDEEGFHEELVDELGDEEPEVEEKSVGASRVTVPESIGVGRRDEEPKNFEGNGQAEEDDERRKVENAPYAVPTGGTFYMHDDRFRQDGRGRPRRMLGRQKLWENKDEKVWVHDRFEELNLQDAWHGEARRTSRGWFRGQGRGRSRARDAGRGFADANKTEAYNNDNSQCRAPRSVKGRGPRHYELIKRGKEVSTNRKKEYVKPHEVMSNNNFGGPSNASSVEPALVVPPRTVTTSNLNSASPPFYPSSSSNKVAYQSQRSFTKTGSANKNLSSSAMQLNRDFSSLQPGNLMKGKESVCSDGYKLYLEDSVQAVAGRAAAAKLQHSLSAFSSINASQNPESKVEERSKAINGLPNSHIVQSASLAAQVSASSEPPVARQRQVKNPAPLASQVFTGQQTGYVPRASPPLEASSANSFLDGENESPTEPGKPKLHAVRHAKPSNLGQGRGSFLYNGAQVLGATGAIVSNGDQGFPATPTILPFMQIGGQHHGGVRVPAVGVALPGYMAQPHGYGNSEMTWLPVLTGAPGALDATYPPYISLDSSYYSCASEQVSPASLSRGSNAVKPAEASKQPQRPEILNDELLHRQGKPRRYSEMTFGQ